MDGLKLFVILLLLVGLLCFIALPAAHYWLHWSWRFSALPLAIWLAVFVVFIAVGVWFLSNADFG